MHNSTLRPNGHRTTARGSFPQSTPAVRDQPVTHTVCQLVLSLDIGGAEILARDFAENAGGSFRFVFACLDRCGAMGQSLIDAGYAVEDLHREPGLDFACIRRLARFCRQHDVNLIHAHQMCPFSYACLARLLTPTLPILLTEHGRFYPDRRRWKSVIFNRLMLRRTDRVVAVGNYVKQALVMNEGFPAERVDVVYNGRSLSDYRQDPIARFALRQQLGITNDDVVVIQIARLCTDKDHLTSVRAIAHLGRQHPHVKLLVVGDGPERSAIEALVHELQIRPLVRILGARNDVSALLSAADICLLSSVNEAIPLTLIEGMATSLPCVATRVGGIPEVVCDQETGLLAAPADPAGLAACLHRLVTDPVARARMGQAGRRRAEVLFDSRRMHREYHAIYRSLLSGSGVTTR